MVYAVSYDKVAWWITGVITVVFLLLIALQIGSLTGSARLFSLLSSVVLVGIYGICYLLRITGYEVTPAGLLICRPIRSRRIPLKDIVNAEILPQEKLRGTIRLFGNGGLFGYWGKFSNGNIGRMTWYATRYDTVVLLRLQGGEKVVISPNDPAGLLQAIAPGTGA